MTSNSDVRKITFTGSTEVGRLLMKQSADTIKKLSLELEAMHRLSSLTTLISTRQSKERLFPNIETPGKPVFARSSLCSGRRLRCFRRKAGGGCWKAKVGNGIDPDVLQGPLVDFAAVEKTKIILGAVAKGGRVLLAASDTLSVGRFSNRQF